MITMDTLALPTPSAFSVDIRSASGTERFNTLGQRIFDGRREKRSLSLRWNRMDPAQLQQLFSHLDGRTFFSLTYPDPVSGEKSITCFARDRSARVWCYPGEAAWADVQLTLEEQ